MESHSDCLGYYNVVKTAQVANLSKSSNLNSNRITNKKHKNSKVHTCPIVYK